MEPGPASLEESHFRVPLHGHLEVGRGVFRSCDRPDPDFIGYVNNNFPNNVSNQVLQTYILPAYGPGGLNPNSGFVTAGTLAGSNCTGSTVIATEVGNIPCNFPVTGVANYSATNPRNGFQYTGRVDHSFSDRDKIFLTFNKTDLHQVAFGEPSFYPAFNTIEPTYSEHFAADWVHASASGRWVNEAGFSTQRVYGDLSVNVPQVPGIAINGLSPGGNNAETFQQGWGPNAFVQNNFEWRDVASLTRGSHSLKMGGNVTRGRMITNPHACLTVRISASTAFSISLRRGHVRNRNRLQSGEWGGRQSIIQFDEDGLTVRLHPRRLEGETELYPEPGFPLRRLLQSFGRDRKSLRNGFPGEGYPTHPDCQRGDDLSQEHVQRYDEHMESTHRICLGSHQGRQDVDSRRYRHLL